MNLSNRELESRQGRIPTADSSIMKHKEPEHFLNQPSEREMNNETLHPRSLSIDANAVSEVNLNSR